MERKHTVVCIDILKNYEKTPNDNGCLDALLLVLVRTGQKLDLFGSIPTV